jgi:hypothetical protein
MFQKERHGTGHNVSPPQWYAIPQLKPTRGSGLRGKAELNRRYWSRGAHRCPQASLETKAKESTFAFHAGPQSPLLEEMEHFM